MKREEFWLGVCVYLLIVLAGHLGPDFSKIPFLNEKICLFLNPKGSSFGEETNRMVKAKESFINTLAMKAPSDLKGSSRYGQARPQKASSRFRLMLKGNSVQSKSQSPARGPVQPIAFYL